MRTESLTGSRIIIACDRCENPLGSTKVKDGLVQHKELTANECWFMPPGGRGSVRFLNEVTGGIDEKRVQMFDLCSQCASKVMTLIEDFVDSKVEEAPESEG